MSMPVFNITNGTQTSWDLIGVVGLDVPISEILNEIPFYRVSKRIKYFFKYNLTIFDLIICVLFIETSLVSTDTYSF